MKTYDILRSILMLFVFAIPFFGHSQRACKLDGATPYSTTFSANGGTAYVTLEFRDDECEPVPISFSTIPSWLNVLQYSDDTIYVSCNVNSGAQRNTLVTVTSTYGDSANFSIVQNAAVSPDVPDTPTIVSNNCGEATLVRVAPPSGVTWYWQTPANGANGTNTSHSSASYSVTSSGTYYLRARNNITHVWSNGAASRTVNVISFDGGEINGAQSICYGGNPYTLNSTASSSGGSGGYSYQWQYSTNGTNGWTNIGGATSLSYNPPGGLTESRWYRRRVTSCGGQMKYSNSTIKVTVHPNVPEPTLVVDNQPSCSDPIGRFEITNYNQSLYSYSVSPSGTISNGMVTVSSSGNYTVTATRNGCSATSSSVTINAVPTVLQDAPTIGSVTQPTCSNPTGSFQITNFDDGTYNYSVSPSGSISGGGLVTVSTPGNYTVTATLNGCSATSLPVTINAVPTVLQDAPALGSITQPTCSNPTGSFQITNFDDGTYNYSVSPSGSISGSGLVTVSTSGDYYVTATQGNCTATSVTVSINGLSALAQPSVGVLLQPTCSNINGIVEITNFDASYDYTVNPSAGVSVDMVQGTIQAPAGNYSITAQLGQCSSSSTGFAVNEQPDCLSSDPEDHNYVYTRTYQIKSDNEVDSQRFTQNDTLIQEITFFDGLGRPFQQVGVAQTPKNGNGDTFDVVTHIGYDNLGRQKKEWLPYPEYTDSFGDFRPEAQTETEGFYYTSKYDLTLNPYTEKEYESSPLNRVLEQAAPGNDWALGQGHEIEMEYDTNLGTDNVRQFAVALNLVGDTYEPTLRFFEEQPNVDVEFYSSGELYKTITKNENHPGTSTKLHTTEEFTDKADRLILKRTYALVNGVEEPHDTYYVYDDYGNLTYVLPPLLEATTATLTEIVNNMDDVGYQYIYDHRNRLVEKKVPGKGWEYMVYNKLDQLVLTQDANQRESDEWSFTKYDAFGRVVYTGLYTNGPSEDREDLQGYVDDTTTYELYEEPQGSSINFGQADVFYTKDAFPDSNMEVLTINYYDGYDFLANESITLLPATVFGDNELQVVNYNGGNSLLTKGLATGSKVKVLETNDWITTATGYNDKGRAIYSYSENEYLGTTDILESKLDFTGKSLQVYTSHTKDGITIATLDNFEYDHVGRLLKQTQCIGDHTMGYDCELLEVEMNTTLDDAIVTTGKTATQSITILPGATGSTTLSGTLTLQIDPNATSGGGTSIDEELITYNKYDDLGQLEEKKIGGTPNTTYDLTEGLQTVDYTYNVRGWLKTINDPTTLGDDLFAFGINYNSTELGSPNVDPLYNGNISETIWTTVNDASGGYTRGYAYEYDALNRITNADYGIKTTGNYNLGSGYDIRVDSYDKNGNIESLFRNSSAPGDAQDDIRYAYSGNQLLKVDELATTTQKDEGFKDGINTGNDYDYDANGNMTSDLNKGIQANGITYNHLNLPTNIVTGSGNISYVYDAVGTKLQKTAGSSVTSYAGNYVYSGPSGSEALQFISQPEGYATPNGMAGYDYVYQYKDHLGNVRLSYTDDPSNPGTPTIIEENNYYPFGLKHKGYNEVPMSPLGNDMAQKWKFGGKEYDDTFDINTYDFGARNYDPALGRWMNIDPLAEQTGYIYAAMNNNPIAMNDPTGMIADWVPKVNEDGSTSYIAEAGDSAATLSEQYGIDQEQAEQITGTTGDTEIAEGTEVSGEQVENVTGSDVLKLDVTSKMATDQRVFDQYKFGNEYSHRQFELGQRGEDGFYTSEFFGNIGDTHRQVWDGTATINIGGEAVPVNFSIPLSYNDGVYFNVKKRPFFLHNSWERKNLFNGSAFGDRERGIMNYFYPVSASWGKGKENLNRMLIETRIGIPGPQKRMKTEKRIKG